MTTTRFQPGARYRVLQEINDGFSSRFTMDEVLTFERDTYSFYDGIYFYIFRNAADDTKEWSLPKAPSIEECNTYFEKIS